MEPRFLRNVYLNFHFLNSFRRYLRQNLKFFLVDLHLKALETELKRFQWH